MCLAIILFIIMISIINTSDFMILIIMFINNIMIIVKLLNRY